MGQRAELEFAPGILTEETDRGAIGRYKNCDHVRFRQMLPEKLGGWILASLGLEDTSEADIEHETSQFTGLSTTYAPGASNIPLESAFTVSDGDPIWLFGESKSGGWANVIIDDVAATEGAFMFDLDTAVTANIGDCFMISYEEEFAGGTSVASGNTVGSKVLVLSNNVISFIQAETIVRIDLDGGGVHWTKTETDILSGTATITLQEALPDIAAAGNSVKLFAKESDIVSDAFDFSYVIRFLAIGVAASTTIRLTEALPVDSDQEEINIFAFEEVAANGDQTSVTSLAITPNSTIGNSDGDIFDESIVMAPQFFPEQVCYEGFARQLHDWVDLDGERWAAIGTDVKLYVVNNGQLFDITPLRDSGTLTGPFDTVLDSQVVTVNDVAHGGQVGNYVRFSGAGTVGGLDLNDEFTIDTVIDADSYTIIADFPATSTVVGGGGTVQYEYDIDIGRAGNQTVQGWGTGPYGAGLYGFGSTVTGIAQRLRIWSLDNFGEDLLAAPNGGSLYHWDLTNGTASRAVLVPTAPSTIQRMLISPEARHVIAFGAGTGSASAPGDPDKLLIRWASSEDFTDWIPTTVNSAGDLRLDKGSEILTAVESRGDIIVNTDESLHAMQFIGGDLVFSLRHLGQSVSIIGPNAAVDVNGIMFFQGEDDFLVYDGVLRVLECEVRNTVFDDINGGQGDKVYASVNKLFTEVWFFYPSASADEPDRYVKYNYKDGVWDFGTIERTAFHDSSAFLGNPYATQGGKLFLHESGVDAADGDGVLQPLVSFLQSYDIEIEPGGEHIMHVSSMTPDFKRLVGSIDFTLTGREYPQDPASENSKGPFTVLPTTRKQDLRMRARQVSLEVRSDLLGDDWRMGTWRATVRPHGRRGGGT